MKTLWSWVLALDRVLRGEATRVADVRDGAVQIPLFGIAFVVTVLGMFYGVCMGTYAVVNYERWMQMLASALKVPALFLLTLLVTLPSLYVFNALVGSRLTAGSVVRLFVAALGVNLAVLASLGPIVAFFSVNTISYSFMVLLNVLVFAVSGLLSLVFLFQTLHRLNLAFRALPPSPSPTASPSTPPDDVVQAELVDAPVADEPGPLNRIEGHMFGRHVQAVFACWTVLFGLVGAQMGWVLRPFIGSPDLPFSWFRERESNFFEAVSKALAVLFN